MADIIVRDWAIEQLRALLPAGYVLIPVQRTIDVLAKPTVLFRQERIGRQVVDGRTIPGGRIVGATLTIAVPSDDTGIAERLLDDHVVTLLDAIDQVPNMRWTSAEKRILTDNGQEPCYDIALEIPYQHAKGA